MLADISRIASGQFIAQLMLLISLPFITRYYNPEEFGVFAVFSAITWILVVFSTGKIESLIITMKNKNQAVALTVGVLLIVLSASLTIVAIIEFFLSNFLNILLSRDIEYLSVLVGITVLFTGSAQILRYYATYLGNFSGHGVAAVLNAVGIISVSLGYAIFIGGESLPIGIILGQIVGQALSLFVFLFYTDIVKMVSLKMLRSPFIVVFNQARKIPVLLVTQLASTLSVRISTLIMSAIGGVASAGAFSMSERIVSMPTSTFGQAVGQVARHRFSKEYEFDNQNTSLPRKVISFTFLITTIGYGLLIVSADWFVPFFLGEQWKIIIPFVQIIAIMELFNFVFYSVEDIAIIRNNFIYRMWSQIIQLISLIVLYIVVDMTNILLSVEWVLGLICLARILFVVYDLTKTWRGVKHSGVSDEY
jgi:O-antigen/teichoic acid export membrane protein